MFFFFSFPFLSYKNMHFFVCMLQRYAYFCRLHSNFFFSSCKLIIHFSSIGLSQNDSNNVFGLAFKRSKANKCWELLVSCVGHSVPLFINTIYVPPLFPHGRSATRMMTPGPAPTTQIWCKWKHIKLYGRSYWSST